MNAVNIIHKQYGVIKKFFLVTFLSVSMSTAIIANGSGSFSLDLNTDLVIGVSSIGSFGLGLVLDPEIPNECNAFCWFDEGLNIPYSSSIDKLGDIGMLVNVLALPLLLDSFDFENSSKIGVMYAEAALLTYGFKDILKALVSRPRPYVFLSDTPSDLLTDSDAYASFPSGHAAMSFMTASFCTYIFSQGNTSIESKWLMGITTFGIASATAILRVYAGVHNPFDVLAGAILGSCIGIGVPMVHQKKQDAYSINFKQNMLMLTFSY